jgi:N-acetyl-anhydromuramyl-L-alanine amidase AmpD
MRTIQAKYCTAGRSGRPPRWIVIHTTEGDERPGSAESVAEMFARGDRRTSAHFVVDASEVISCVQSVDTAWHIPGRYQDRSVNTLAIGIEHCGTAHQTAAQWADATSEAMLRRSAGLAAVLCRKWNIPCRRVTKDDLKRGLPGITGHVDCSEAFGGTHWDPGPHWPWAHYLALVKEHLG